MPVSISLDSLSQITITLTGIEGIIVIEVSENENEDLSNGKLEETAYKNQLTVALQALVPDASNIAVSNIGSSIRSNANTDGSDTGLDDTTLVIIIVAAVGGCILFSVGLFLYFRYKTS